MYSNTKIDAGYKLKINKSREGKKEAKN
jgi:hypothetical protein